MDSWFLAAVRGSSGNERMVAEDPLRRVCLGHLKNIPAQTICIALLILQAYLINSQLVSSSENKLMWIWFIADIVVVLAMVVSFFLREWRLEPIAAKHKEPTGFAKGLPLASLGWFIYAVFLGARISLIFKNDLAHDASILEIKLTISLTAIICVMFTMGHHHNHESLARRAAILSLAKMFTIDLLDTVDVLDVLFDTAKENPETFPIALEDFVLAIVTLNLMRPTVVLISLFVDHFASTKRSLQIKVGKTVIELMLLNLPLLFIRVYISIRYQDLISVFLVKNILATMYGVIEIYDCSYDINQSDEMKDEAKPVNTYTNGGTQLEDESKTEGIGSDEVEIAENETEMHVENEDKKNEITI